MSEEPGLAVPTSVKERRKALKWSQERLAQEAGISTTAVHNLEAAKNGFTDKTLAALAAALGCKPVELLMPMRESIPAVTSEDQLRSAMLAFGVDRHDLGRAVSAVRVFIDDLDEQSGQVLPDDQSSPASRRREVEPSR